MSAVLGRYRVLKHLTSGGMAEVLLGRSDGIEGFERHVVLKRIRPEHARDQRFISMFLDEARLAAGLHHQAIVQVFDIGESNGEYFFAMEYIHGEDLRKILASVWKAKAHVPLGNVCAIVSAVASGLHYAHERRDNRGRALNIVHRDVSPSNVLVGYDGAVKVLDFGIAKAAVRQAETAVRSLKGKTSYMSPEQCKGEQVDRRSDVYGLGVLLYELATTSRLFKGENEYLVMDAIVNGKFAMPRVRRPDLPNELSSIIMRALATDPARRYQTAEELRFELDRFASNHDLTASTSTLASYMRKLFGDRPEPWLDGDEAEISIQEAGASWTDGQSEDAPRRLSDNALGRRSSRSSLAKIAPSVVAASDTAQRISPYETTAPSLKFGWEARPVPSARTNKLLWASVPALVLIAFGLWKFGLSKHHAASPAVASATHAAATAPAPVSAVAPAPAPAAVAPTPAPAAAAPVAVATTEPAPEAATRPAHVVSPPVEVAHADAEMKKATAKPAKKADAPKPEQVAVAEPAATTKPAPLESKPVAPAPATATPPAPAPVPAAAPAPPPAAPAITAATAPAPEPKIVDAQIATLSNATVSAVASDHSRQLSSCEGGATLHGDVSVSFQIDGSGKVVKSQLATTIKNPKISACILKAVLSWKFPKPPTGHAKGVYSISYQ